MESEALDGYDPVARGEQAKDGTDLVGIRYNLSLSPLERIEQHRRALESILWLKEFKRVPRPSSHC